MANDSTTAILTATDLEVRYNEQLVLNKASLTICERDRIGMVGRNGSGKSTFLRILAGEQQPDAGTQTRRRDLVIGYLSQEFTLDLEKNVYENVRAGAKHVLDLIHQFESLPAESKRHDELEERIRLLDGWGLEHRLKTAMSHLNVPDGERRIDTLSGGEKRRVAMCRAIISRPDLLILDEPTNHLDPESIEWVGDFLKEFPGAFLLVTHDRYFLDRITSTIVEVANGTFYSYTGNYTDYLVSKAERQATEELVEHKRQMFLRRELDWVRRGPKARTTKSKSRLDRYYEVAGQGPGEIESDMELVIPPPPQLGNRVVELSNAGMTLGGKRLFGEFDFTFENGMRIGVAGRNGLGKTTLLKVIIGDLAPTEGTVKIGPLTKFNYIDQGRLLLREERTVFEEVGDGTEFVIFGEEKLSLRAYLKRFLFTDERINTQVKYLSGGERSRLLLARILKNGGNFLVLDEPTNDLDLPTLRILEEALVAFPGCVLVVSHDRYFLNRVCTGILSFEGDERVSYSVGDYDYYLEKSARSTAAVRNGKTASLVSTPPAAVKPTGNASRARKLSFKETRELEGIEAQIMETEVEIARIEALFALPNFHQEHGQQTNELMAKIAATKNRLAQLFARWEELEKIGRGAG
ncbi:MAG: transporter [Pedosphaera sp.]|nr:transporter [Pedosphaera sp.]